MIFTSDDKFLIFDTVEYSDYDGLEEDLPEPEYIEEEDSFINSVEE